MPKLMMQEPVAIVGMARTPIGAMQGVFATVSAPQLGGHAIKGALDDGGIDPTWVDEVLMGCVLSAGLGQAPAKQAALAAGIEHSVPCSTMNKVCGSGMKTVMLGCQAILSGSADVVVAGGMENMSLAPHLLNRARGGYRLGHGELLDHMFTDGLEDAYSGELMGTFADNTADRYNISRADQDEFAKISLARAKQAMTNGWFSREISPITVAQRKARSLLVDTDEQPGKLSAEKLASLRPAFRQDGSVTAGNASSIADGGAAVVLMRESEATRRGVKVLARVIGFSQYAHEPNWFTTAPIHAVSNLLSKLNRSADDVDLYEINEAFAVVTLAAMQALSLDHSKVNVYGGACALGHPLGASGARILLTLLAALEQREQSLGVATLCIGGGEAVAMAVQRG